MAVDKIPIYNDIPPSAIKFPPKEKQVGGDHYKTMKIQPNEYIMANGLNWCQGNVIKYITRYPNKNGIEDLKKAIHYIELEIERLSKI